MLDKRSKRVLWIFGLTLLLILVTEIVRPKPIDWRPSYTSIDKIPFGSFVFFEEASSLFKDSEIENIDKDPYLFLVDSTYNQNSAYIFINEELNFDKRQTQILLKYVEKGNTVFISSRSYGNILQDTLKINLHTSYSVLEEEVTPTFFSPSLKEKQLPKFKKGIFKTSFTAIDTLKTKALGYYDSNKDKLDDLNFIKVKYGNGAFLLHTLPEAFTNYYLLKKNEQYAANLISYIEADHIYLDEYLKSGRKVVTSPMRFVLNQEPLTWAYYVVIGGLIIFVLFKGKREQRIVEVIEPLENTSVEFTKTIADLYFQHKDYSDIIAKKIKYFSETLRAKYFLNTTDITEDLIKKLALKSGNTLEDTQKLMHLIKILKEKTVHSEADLLALNKKIEEFRL
ncbi:DUF4350 domain-containing protein [Aequorivita xiaoshiensis]|uniref:DUF4350 domain-containing protein n=1 Tax=Aequorivita xiaoshiensis TaxID=2874476 RepID=A0A9X1R1D7_9FLAO|nr:DUF4350 domain-containing protein [Aequorivita xiaoshiensis]MCG2430172.1 DUF4350 domain-containing protein [Aequorivita xiaoshiensis]